MFLQRGSRAVRAVQRQRGVPGGSIPRTALRGPGSTPRWFHATGTLGVVKPVVLADIGEGTLSDSPQLVPARRR